VTLPPDADPPEPSEQSSASEPPGAEPKSDPPRRKRVWRRYLAVAVLSPLLMLLLYTVIAYYWTYSEGDRSGVLRKLSRKGWLCKTWEGELALTPVPGAIPEVWAFTVRDDSAARAINAALGKSVVLHYSEHRGLWSSCFGDTRYFVDSLRLTSP
jgi:hypothetical protein